MRGIAGYYISYSFHSMPSGALRSTLLLPTSPQLVLRTVPPDSVYIIYIHTYIHTYIHKYQYRYIHTLYYR